MLDCSQAPIETSRRSKRGLYPITAFSKALSCFTLLWQAHLVSKTPLYLLRSRKHGVKEGCSFQSTSYSVELDTNFFRVSRRNSKQMASTHQESSSLSFRLNLYLNETLEARLDSAFPVFELVFSAVLCRFVRFSLCNPPSLLPTRILLHTFGHSLYTPFPPRRPHSVPTTFTFSKYENRSKLCFSAYIRCRFSRRGLLGLNCQAPLRTDLIHDEQRREQRVCGIKSTTLFEI